MDVIGVWPTPYADTILLEGNRFWFYSLVCSILWGVVQLFERHNADGESKKSDEKRPARKSTKDAGLKSKAGVKRRLVSDCFDLLVPGSVLGWISASTAMVGAASVVSTVLSSKDIWDSLKD